MPLLLLLCCCFEPGIHTADAAHPCCGTIVSTQRALVKRHHFHAVLRHIRSSAHTCSTPNPPTPPPAPPQYLGDVQLSQGGETSAEYSIHLPRQLPPREFILQLTLVYAAGGQFKTKLFFNETIQVRG